MGVQVWLIGRRNDHFLSEAVGGSIYASKDRETPVGVAWGPAADGSGNWFARRSQDEAIRLDDREAALDHITTDHQEI